jgi:uncharacterized membrane protein YagU involved in acid resistance
MFKVEKLGVWGVIILTTVYFFVMNMFFEYVINREVYPIVQIWAGLIVLFYTVLMVRLIVNLINNFLKKEEND